MGILKRLRVAERFVAAHEEAEHLSHKEFQLSIHGMFEGAVLRMLEKRPEDRFETPIELLKDLERIGKFAGIDV